MHATTQIVQRGLTIDGVINDWNNGMFVKCFMDRKEEHYLTHIPEQNVFFLMVTSPRRGDYDVITCMPLTHRDRVVSEDFKNEAYNLRHDIDFDVSESLEGIPRDIAKAMKRLKHEKLMREQQEAKRLKLIKAKDFQVSPCNS